jgi:hypothetical protein
MLVESPSSLRRALTAAALVVLVLVGIIALLLELGARFEGQQCTLGAAGPVGGVPARIAPIYQAAATKYQLGAMGPAYLAAVNYIETGFGADLSASSAGAVGWMQFEPPTWAAFGVTPSGAPARDGPAGWNDPQDAIFSAANYLRHLGAPGNWWNAIYQYGGSNPAEASESGVLARRYYAQGLKSSAGSTLTLSTGSCQGGAPGQYVDPLSQAAGLTPMRIDQGVDYALAGPMLAVGDGVVSYVGEGGGSGWPSCVLTGSGTIVSVDGAGAAVVYRLTDGPDAGRYVYIAENVKPLVRSQQRVSAGTAMVTVYGSSAGLGCIETGWANGPGDSPQAAADGQSSNAGDSGENRTFCGQQFSDLLQSLGAPAGLSEGKPVVGSSC